MNSTYFPLAYNSFFRIGGYFFLAPVLLLPLFYWRFNFEVPLYIPAFVSMPLLVSILLFRMGKSHITVLPGELIYKVFTTKHILFSSITQITIDRIYIRGGGKNGPLRPLLVVYLEYSGKKQKINIESFERFTELLTHLKKNVSRFETTEGGTEQMRALGITA